MNFWIIRRNQLLTVKSIFVTRHDTKFCQWCHKPIPSGRAHNAKYCSEECTRLGRKAYRQGWYRKNKVDLKSKRDEKKAQELREFGRKAQTAKLIGDFVNGKDE